MLREQTFLPTPKCQGRQALSLIACEATPLQGCLKMAAGTTKIHHNIHDEGSINRDGSSFNHDTIIYSYANPPKGMMGIFTNRHQGRPMDEAMDK